MRIIKIINETVQLKNECDFRVWDCTFPLASIQRIIPPATISVCVCVCVWHTVPMVFDVFVCTNTGPNLTFHRCACYVLTFLRKVLTRRCFDAFLFETHSTHSTAYTERERERHRETEKDSNNSLEDIDVHSCSGHSHCYTCKFTVFIVLIVELTPNHNRKQCNSKPSAQNFGMDNFFFIRKYFFYKNQQSL